jgi:formate hydrogenlyase subunit 3/multisubunit Na+/H+ antiporter MnhD subunit
MTTTVWLLPFVLPLAAAGWALVAGPKTRALLLPLAPLPALVFALAGPPAATPDLSWILLDVHLDADPVGRLLLAMTAVVWIAAGASARPLAAAAPGFASLFLLTLTGNLGLLVAADVVSLYAGFALMTFSAYGLVVHERSPFALRAGRVYVVLAAIGEVLLLAGLLLAVAEAEATTFAEVSAAIAGSGRRELVVGLLVVGFGIKAGIVPLHLWLPLAHPAAPVPASAVLSGTMIKAGLVGWLRVLPLGEVGLPGWAAVLLGLGLASAFAGVLLGLVQDDPKVILAYSSISQMGIITTMVAVGLGVPGAAVPAVLAASLYAAHHGFAKGALFLGVGVAKRTVTPERHRWVLGGMLFAALSLAGAPLTSGWVAKGATKEAVAALGAGGGVTAGGGRMPGPDAEALTLLLSLAAAGTTLLMVRLLWSLRRPATAGPAPGPDDRVAAFAWVALLAVVAVGSWVLPRWLLPGLPAPEVYGGALWDGLWPLLLGGGLAAAGWAADRGVARSRGPGARPSWWARRPAVPAGDVVVLVEAAVNRTARGLRVAGQVVDLLQRLVLVLRRGLYLAVLPGRGLDRVDRWLTRWQTAGAAFVLIGIALVVALVGTG